MKKVLVAGATGYIGRYVVKEFKKQGYWIRTLARNSARLDDLREYVDEDFIGEVPNPNTLSGICEGIDVVFSSIGITKQKDGLTYMDVDYQDNVNLLEEAKKASVLKFIFISALHGEKLRNLKMIQAKECFVDELKSSGMDIM